LVDTVQASLAGMSAEAPSLASLTQADPAGWPVHSAWRVSVRAFFASPAGVGLMAFLKARLAAGATIYPPEPLRALALTPLPEVRIVILGQDPYHGAGQAEGLAFSVSPGTRIPPSLRNIFKELKRDLGLPAPVQGSLVPWATRGVLLLNTCLTVEKGQPASHARQGWEVLTDELIQGCSDDTKPKVFLLWGAHAQAKSALIDTERHLVLSANHPSPLSASRGPLPFMGCGHFGETGRWLVAQGRDAPSW
jgi:uracil-DNA glycosylase